MKNRNNAMYQAMQQSEGTPIDGQQMFEMLSAVANTVNQLQGIIGGMLEVQNRQNESIIAISNNIKKVACQLVELQKQQGKMEG